MQEDVYDDAYLDTLIDNDELSPKELGIMHWYDIDGDLSFETEVKGSAFEPDLYPLA